MRVDDGPNPSWICRTDVERTRFLDLHHRLLATNTRLLVALIVVIVLSLPFMDGTLGLIPAAAGMLLFGGIQRNAERFTRPELWVFGALLGAETMIVIAVCVARGVSTTDMMVVAWPVAGVAGRFSNRASRLGLAYAAVLVVAATLIAAPGILGRDPLSVGLLVLGLVAVHAVASVLRDSDVEHRGAAILDPLTGMLNRAALRNRTEEIEYQSRVTGEPVGVIVADLDCFKQVNDTYGHATGDAVLQEVAYRLRGALRAYDLAYRLGGEEFVVLLLGATPEATAVTAEQLRAAIATEPVVGVELTVSIGVAGTARGSSFVWDDVFARADAALYRAKAEGRDRVVSEATELSRA